MKKKLQVELVSYNINNVEVCASAARISTTKGTAFEIFEKSKHNENNQNLIQKVLLSGHKSIIEHSVFTIAFKDVSVFVEEFFIEHRLSSFTVKSRRYVDFSEAGYYIPPSLSGKELNQYCQYMDLLFSAYKTMLDGGIPKEDARFLLPYSFNSNFYCTLNARELTHIIHDIRHGHGQGIPELQEVASQIIEQIEAVFPCICFELDGALRESNVTTIMSNTVTVEDSLTLIESTKIGEVSLLNEPKDPFAILNTAYGINHPEKNIAFDIGMLIESKRPRELEQLTYTFLISDMTLSGITHIVRHRMQSIVVPPIQELNHSKFIIPDTIKNNSQLFEIYKHVLESANNRVKQMRQNETLKQYSYYYALSGNVMNIMMSMNARELKHFIKVRACNRAQWEIRNISIGMLKHLRHSFPELFNNFGPSCLVDGKCPEGKMTCGKTEDVIGYFRNLT